MKTKGSTLFFMCILHRNYNNKLLRTNKTDVPMGELVKIKMKKIAIIVIAAIAMFLTAGSSKVSNNVVTPFVSVTSDDWTGEIWVQKFTYENEGRVVVDWHLMATNTTGEGSCVEGLIRYNGRKITIVGYVPASADKREKAVSIYHLPNKFEIIPDTFYSTDENNCL